MKSKTKKEEISQGFSDVKSDPRFLNSYVLHMNTVVFVGGGGGLVFFCSSPFVCVLSFLQVGGLTQT